MSFVVDALDLAGRQHQVVSIEQLVSGGLSRRSAFRLAEGGVLVRLYHGVYAVRGAPLTFEARAIAAVLASGPHSLVSHRSAGALWGFRGMRRAPIDLTVVGQRWHHELDGVRRHHADRVLASDVVERPDGITLTSPLRTLFGLAWLLLPDAFEQAFEDARLKGLVTVADARRYWQRLHQRGRNGSDYFGQFVYAADPESRPTESGLEVVMVQALRRMGMPDPARQHPLRLDAVGKIRLDLAYPDRRLAIECDHTWWHASAKDAAADARHDEALVATGWQVLRFVESRLEAEPDRCAFEVMTAFLQRP